MCQVERSFWRPNTWLLRTRSLDLLGARASNGIEREAWLTYAGWFMVLLEPRVIVEC